MFSQSFTDQTGSTGQVKDFDIGWFLFALLSELGNIVGDVFWIWIATLEVHALVVRGEIVVAHDYIFFLVLVAALVHELVLIGKAATSTRKKM
jgi:hypothetical protein